MLRRAFCRIAMIVVVICGLLGLSSVLLAQGRSEQALDRVIEVQERHTERLMAIEGVTGTAVALNPGGQAAVAVLLERPGVGGIPQELEGVPVHPFVTGEIYALQPPEASAGALAVPSARFPRPVPIGVSTGHPAITAGTIGCRVRDAGGTVYALSNNHVYAAENAGPLGVNVLQPGPYDGGVNPTDAIGTLSDFQPIHFDGSPNTIDAAIALSSTSLLGRSTPSDGYGTPKAATATARINAAVKKYGRTTGLTKGRIWAVNAIVNVGYSAGVARFVNQIIITPGAFSAGGDSGSLVVLDSTKRNTTNDRQPVGLLFAGSSSVTIASPIDLVLSRFGVTIDGQ
jgi:hypothetical protein